MKNTNKELNEALWDAVESCDVQRVKECLAKGADPNYYRVSSDWTDLSCQPTTPLRMVMFRISDALLNDDHLAAFGEIARLLLDAGADPGPAMQIAEARYGPYNPHAEKTPFQKVRDLIAKASGH